VDVVITTGGLVTITGGLVATGLLMTAGGLVTTGKLLMTGGLVTTTGELVITGAGAKLLLLITGVDVTGKLTPSLLATSVAGAVFAKLLLLILKTWLVLLLLFGRGLLKS